MEIRTCQFNDSYFPIMDGVGMTAHYYALGLNKKFGEASLVAPKVKGYSDRVPYNVIRFKSVLIPGMNPYRAGLPWIDFDLKVISANKLLILFMLIVRLSVVFLHKISQIN